MLAIETLDPDPELDSVYLAHFTNLTRQWIYQTRRQRTAYESPSPNTASWRRWTFSRSLTDKWWAAPSYSTTRPTTPPRPFSRPMPSPSWAAPLLSTGPSPKRFLKVRNQEFPPVFMDLPGPHPDPLVTSTDPDADPDPSPFSYKRWAD